MIIVLFLIGMVGVSTYAEGFDGDIGKLVVDYTSNDNDEPVKFLGGQIVQIVKETDWGYKVLHNDQYHQISRKHMIRTSRSMSQYEVIRDTDILAYSERGSLVRKLRVGEEIHLISLHGRHGRFKTEDSIEGYVLYHDTKRIYKPNITYGTVLVDEKLSNGETEYLVREGDLLSIKDFIGGDLIILDRENNEYKLDPLKVNLKQNTKMEVVSRGTVNRRKVNDTGSKIVEYAKTQLGKKYVYATSGPSTFDCSGFTSYVYNNAANIKIPRSSLDQSKYGKWVDRSELQQGDLIFFKTTSAPVGHVGIYIGDGDFIHASTSNRVVRISNLTESYYSSRYVVSRRVLQ